MLLLDWRPTPGVDVAPNLHDSGNFTPKFTARLLLLQTLISKLSLILREFSETLEVFCSCPETAHLTLSPVRVCFHASDACSSLNRLFSVWFLLMLWLQSSCVPPLSFFEFALCNILLIVVGLLTFPWTWLCWVEPVAYTGTTIAVNTA